MTILRSLDYFLRIALSALILYVVIVCPLDSELSSGTCKALYLYRQCVLVPAAARFWGALYRGGGALYRASSMTLVWLQEALYATAEACESREMARWNFGCYSAGRFGPQLRSYVAPFGEYTPRDWDGSIY
ncbi:hypothetical protein OH77DRAFT_1440367 [Trametes cingulata]|nr:hypothetical protein OH77DRAFT_1440367 [Trametes cingulata]